MILVVQELGKHLENVKSWNPQLVSSNEIFAYIDLSSVDKDKKAIDLSQIQQVMPANAPSRARQIVKKSDILVSTVRPNLNGVAFVPDDLDNATASTGYCVLRANEKTLSAQYLFHWVQSNSFINEMVSKATGANYPAVSDKIIKQSKIPLPPLAEQQKIAAILDAADSLRQKDQQLVERYTALSQSLFLEMFGDPVTNPMGWVKAQLNTLCSFKKISISPENITSGTKYIALEGIEKDSGRIINYEKVENGELKSNKFYFDEETILYGKLRPYLNKVALPKFDGICSTEIIPLKPFPNKTNKFFIVQILRSAGFVKFAHENSSGANLPRINPNEIEKHLTIGPPIELQNQFAERIQLIEAQKQQAQLGLAKSEALFNSLLQRAFTGELTAKMAA